jgi:hypothetical protein
MLLANDRDQVGVAEDRRTLASGASIRYNGRMTRGNPNWGHTEPVHWRFCVRGKSPDGKTVTLGHYKTQEEATSHYEQLVNEGYYARLRIDRL